MKSSCSLQQPLMLEMRELDIEIILLLKLLNHLQMVRAFKHPCSRGLIILSTSHFFLDQHNKFPDRFFIFQVALSRVSKEMGKNEGHVKNICYVNQMEVVSWKFVHCSRDHLVMEQVEEHAGRVKYVLVMVYVKVSNYSNLSKMS